MSKQKELIKELQELQRLAEGDAEAAHSKADKLLLQYIDDPQITEVYNGIKRWCA